MGGATLHIAIVLLAVLSSSVHGKTRTDCLPERYQPSNVTITKGIKKKPELYVNGELFEVKGIGYSPIPPGKNTLNEQFDFFTSDRDYIWKRDVPIIANMGANVIRTWSWDATLDHTAFLNLCHHHGLKVLIPFGVTPIEYPDLADPATRHQLMTDWKAFIHKVRNHPALFGYMIGNELNEAYAGQFEELFSAVNAMVALRDEYDSKKHPITLPFSDNNFMEDLVEKYYPWLNIDFWSLQIYRDAINIDSVSSEYSELFLEPDLMSVKKGMFHQLPIKPLIFTEYGIDALDGDTCESWNRSCTTKEVTRLMLSDTPVSQNETKQALGFCNRYSAIRNGTYNTSAYVNGGVIMEYVDEWWKGTFPDVRREECPNQRTDVHTYCASNINKHNNNTKADFLHEEWLGLFRQIPTLADTNKLVEDMDYCIHPRLAQCVMGLAFELKSSADLDCMGLVLQCNQTFNQHPVPQYCATKKTLWNNYIMMWIVPPMLILIAVIVILRVYLKRGWRSLMMMDYQQLNDHSPELEPEQEGPSANEQGVGVNGEAAKSANPDIIDVSKNEPRCDNLLGGIDPKIIEKECKVLENIINQAFWKYTAARSEESTFTKWAEPKVKGANSVNVEQFFEQHLRNKPCPHFVLAQKKIYHAVYDQFSRHIMDTKLSDRTDKDVECKRLMGRAVRIVFEKYTEGYYLYLDRPSPEENDVKKSIEILSLYMLTQQWSGTINHAPEKICELLNWSLQYFENISKKDAVILDSNCERLKKRWEERTGWVINYHYGLVEIIRTYCLKVQEGFSFDDINSDSIYIRKRLMKQNKDVGSKSSSDFLETPSCLQSETIIGTEGDLLPTKSNIQNRRSAIHGTHLEYNSACRPEEVVTSYSANHFFKSRLPEGNTDGKFLPKNIAFPQRGGVFSLLLNYQWLIRYLVWQNMLASVMQPETVSTPECKQTFVVSGLGIADATMCAVFCFCHRITLGRFKRRLLFETFFYTGSCIMVWITFVFSDYLSFVCHYLNGSCQGNKGPDVLGFTIDVPTVYLLIAVLLAIIDEVRLFAWTYQSNAIKGRFKSMDHYRSVRIGYAICCITGIVIFIILKASSFYSV